MNTVRVVVVGCGTMGSSHARAYAHLKGFELVGLVDHSTDKGTKLSRELGGVPLYESFSQALAAVKPDAVSVCTYPETHYELTLKGLQEGMHVFVEKPLAETVAQADELVQLAQRNNKKVVVGYILRHHPAWRLFIDEAQKLGKPLIMRMNLNQQSSGAAWEVHKSLMRSMSPIVDCGVHYVDVMCQMTRSRPLRVQAIGARVTSEINDTMYNYGQLQVVFDDGSVGWYEAGWGPMMSQTAFFIKDVIGPLGSVSIAEPRAKREGESSDIDSHTKTTGLIKHDAVTGNDIFLDTSDEPHHQALCNREQEYFLKAIQEDLDLGNHLADAVNSLRIVLAADQSVRTGQVVHLI